MRNSFYSSIAKQLQKDQKELEEAEKITKIVFPIIEGLKNRSHIVNPVILKTKLAKLDHKYRDAVYGLCRIAIDGGPEGSFIVLDPEKVLSLLDEIEVEEEFNNKKKKNRKFILGITKKVTAAIKGLVLAKLSALCHLVNDLVLKKVINVPSPDKLKGAVMQVSSLHEKPAIHRSR
ncbi:MAG: hypothetical protein V4612_05120 [Pseudomonadota bacterium]